MHRTSRPVDLHPKKRDRNAIPFLWVEYKMQNPNRLGSDLRALVEIRGVEPLTS